MLGGKQFILLEKLQFPMEKKIEKMNINSSQPRKGKMVHDCFKMFHHCELGRYHLRFC